MLRNETTDSASNQQTDPEVPSTDRAPAVDARSSGSW